MPRVNRSAPQQSIAPGGTPAGGNTPAPSTAGPAPEQNGVAAHTLSAAPRQRSAAADLQAALLGRELNWTERARMGSGATVEAMQQGLMVAVGGLTAAALTNVGSKKAIDSLAQEWQQGADALTRLAQPAARLVQHWKDGASLLAPVGIPAAVLAVGAAVVEYAAPTGPLRELQRVADGPHAQSVTKLVEGICGSRPAPVSEALRPLLLKSLPELEAIVQGPHAAAAQALVEKLLPTSLDKEGKLPSEQDVSSALHGTLGALAGPHAAVFASLGQTLCAGPDREADIDALNGLAVIAAAPHAAPTLQFMRSELDSCADGPSHAALRTAFTRVLPTLGGIAQSVAAHDVLGAFRHMMREHASDTTQAELRLAMLERLSAFARLFAQPAVDARFLKSFLDAGERPPLEKDNVTAGMRNIYHALRSLSEAKPTNRLNQALGLPSPWAAANFWVSKAATDLSRR